ncbi:glycosyltransferase, partial [Clostridium perfringens]
MSEMLCVCIPTCNRQNMLKNLLISIINIIDNNKFNFKINIIVVDNDSNGSSFDCVKKLDKEYIYYFIEKTKGYSNV